MGRLFQILEGYFHQHGYWTVFWVLLLENAGVPVPGETVLLVASFLCFTERDVRLPYIILVGVAAATLGDNLGYIFGRRGGRPLLERYRHLFGISPHQIRRGERLFARHGAVTVFFARFVFGMRVIAGPLAGVLCMPWRRFVLYNAAGAALWVTAIACIGFFFAERQQSLLRDVRDFDWLVAGVVAAGALAWWWRHRRESGAPDE
jgi:membrane protein DedA with SNARE-associated domain